MHYLSYDNYEVIGCVHVKDHQVWHVLVEQSMGTLVCFDNILEGECVESILSLICRAFQIPIILGKAQGPIQSGRIGFLDR